MPGATSAQHLTFRSFLILGATAMLSSLLSGCTGGVEAPVKPTDPGDQAAGTETSGSPQPSLTPPLSPVSPLASPPSPTPVATPTPVVRFRLAINGVFPQPGQNVMEVPSGAVSIRPVPGADGKYDSGSEVVLEASAAWPNASFSWSGVDGQTRSGATVIMGDDRDAVVEIHLPAPTPAPILVPTPARIPTATVTPVYGPTPTPVPDAVPFGWVGGTVKDNWARKDYPLANVSVEGQLSGHKTRTNSEGRYTLFLPVGLEFVTFSSPDIYYPGVRSVEVQRGVDVRTINFTYTHGNSGPCLGKLPFTVEGVVSADSVPVAGARVWLWDTTFETTTDENGIYSIKDGCGELVLAESGGLRGGAMVKISPGSVVRAPKISLSPR